MAKNIQMGSLWDAEELSKVMPNTFWSQSKDKPVTVLGRTFKNDEERREVFRRELREKLPELKKIEGFPIGEDDDIINLSDPPYYTACPNPWLNDFIKEWEDEKKELVAQGKRVEDFEVKEPYATDVSEGKSNPVYNAHTYHTKVPHPAIMRYIYYYTQPGDTIFDGFCGTGMTGVASSICGDSSFNSMTSRKNNIGNRHCICSDLSPIASFIASVYNSPLNKIKFRICAESILNSIKEKYEWMYETNHINGEKAIIKSVVWSDVFVCPNCGNEIIFYDSAYDKENKTVRKVFQCPSCHSAYQKKDLNRVKLSTYDDLLQKTVEITKTVPVLINYTYRNKIYTKIPDKFDLELINKIDNIQFDSWVPTMELIEGFNTQQPMKSNCVNFVHQFYTKRNLYILSKIYERVKENKSLRLWFTSQLTNLSKLNRYRPEVSFPYNPLNGTLYISSQVCESNVFEAYQNKISKFEKAFEFINTQNVVGIASATNSTLDDNTIDYMFVDPPFGANIMYSDLNSIWEGWLNLKTNTKEEAIVNPFQNKKLPEYQLLMNRSLQEFYRLLKPGKWLTMEFSNTSASVWNSIQNALQGVGFVVAGVAALDKQQGSFKSVTTTTAVKQDLIITCYKPSAEFIAKIEASSDKALNVWDFVEDHLSHIKKYKKVSNSTTAVVERSAKILYDKLISYYVSRGYPVPMDAQEFQIGLKERFEERDGMFFTVDQVAKYEKERRKSDGFVPMALMVGDESEGIEWLKRELGTQPQAYQDISGKWMQSLAKPRKGDTIPELMTILEENFICEDGKWRVANDDDAVDMEKLRIKKLLHEFEIYKNHVQTKKTKLKNTRLEVLREGFKKCYKDKDFKTIVAVGDQIEQSLLEEDGILLQYYGYACQRV